MYYYVFEPPRAAKEYERTAQIKEYLSGLGIAGEMATPSPGRSIEDLVESAVSKRYSTVIAVGGVEAINRVARALQPHEAVFGIIPVVEHPDIAKLIGTSDWKQAADQLKRRRWQPVQLGLINREACFLTPASVSLPPGLGYQLVTKKFSLSGQGGRISVTPAYEAEGTKAGLLVEIEPGQSNRRGGLLGSLFGRKDEAPGVSRFILPSLELHTDDPRPVVVANTDLCSTPVFFESHGQTLKLIVSRGGL